MLLEFLLLSAAMFLGTNINRYLYNLQKKSSQGKISVIVWKPEKNFNLDSIMYQQTFHQDFDKNSTEYMLFENIVKDLLRIYQIEPENNQTLAKSDHDIKNDEWKIPEIKPSAHDTKNNEWIVPMEETSKIHDDHITGEFNDGFSSKKTDEFKIHTFENDDFQFPLLEEKQTYQPWKIKDINFNEIFDKTFMYFQEILNDVEPADIFIAVTFLLFIVVMKKIWTDTYGVTRKQHFEASHMEKLLQKVGNLQKEFLDLKVALEDYAIENNNKQRYMLLRMISQEEQMQTINKEYENNVMFRFVQYSNGLMAKVKSLAKKLKTEQKNSKLQKILLERQILEMRSQIKILNELNKL